MGKRTGFLMALALGPLFWACESLHGVGDGPAAPINEPVLAARRAYNPDIDPADFTASITNPYWPMRPGAFFRFAGESDGEPETILVEVTRKKKVILGVACTEVRDRVFDGDGNLVEDTRDWYAQDREGSVWYFGEFAKEFEDGAVSTAGSWEAGVDGAKPGIVMFANPQPGAPYRQEYYPGVAEDFGQVVSLLESFTTGLGTFHNVVKTREFTPLEPGVSEFKYYAPGVGVIREEALSGGTGFQELTEFSIP